MSKNRLGVIILAAGWGKRMKSNNQKTLSNLNGKPIIGHLLKSVLKLKPQKICIVSGYKSNDVKRYIIDNFGFDRFEFVLQRKRLGTAHATRQAEKVFNGKKFDTILLLNGDTPFISAVTLNNLLNLHQKTDSVLTFLTSLVSNPQGYGRIKKINDEIKIVEESDLTLEDRSINEVNAGAYCFKNNYLWTTIKKIKKNKIKGEYYITDILPIISKYGKITTMRINNEKEIINVNTLDDLKKAEEYIRLKK